MQNINMPLFKKEGNNSEVDIAIRAINTLKSRSSMTESDRNMFRDDINRIVNGLTDISLLKKLEDAARVTPEEIRDSSSEKWETLQRVESLITSKIKTIEVMNKNKKPSLKLLESQQEEEPEDMFDEQKKRAS